MFKSNVYIRKKINTNYLINYISSIINELPLILIDIKLSSTSKYPQNKLSRFVPFKMLNYLNQ